MNPPPRPGPFRELKGCDGDGCASARDTWPLHHVYRRGVACHRLCNTCILLSNRSLYCCCCLLLIPSGESSSSHFYEEGDRLVALPIPTATCQVCRDSVAHLACLYPGDGVFVCPPCSAAQMGMPFTYEAPRGEPLDVRAARILVLGAKIALGLLLSNAAAARAEAERLALEARAARTRAYHALSVALELDPKAEVPSWNVNVPAPPPLHAPDINLLAAPGQGSSEANVGIAIPPLAALTIGTEGFRAVSMAPADASASHAHAPPLALPLFNENVVEMTSFVAAASAGSSTPPPAPNLLGVKEMAMAAAEAARASPPALQTLALFPGAKMPPTLQLFQDKIPDDDDEEM